MVGVISLPELLPAALYSCWLRGQDLFSERDWTPNALAAVFGIDVAMRMVMSVVHSNTSLMYSRKDNFADVFV
jgi:hypothetical protein